MNLPKPLGGDLGAEAVFTASLKTNWRWQPEVWYRQILFDMVIASPRGNADGIRVEKDTWACLKEPGWYSSSHSTTLKQKY
jgi:hypothetical protein